MPSGKRLVDVLDEQAEDISWIIDKLLKLKYRINDAYRGGNKPSNGDTDTRADKSWVMNLISDVRENNLTKLCKEDMLKCNEIWRRYK